MPEPEITGVHPAAEIFPLLGENELTELAEDIAEHGLREAIVIDREGRILDGRNRHTACLALARTGHAAELRVEIYEGGDPVAFVISKNLHRRHLSTSQRAMVAARIANLAVGSNQHVVRLKHDPETLEEFSPPLKLAAQQMAVDRKTAQFGKAVKDRGVPELVSAVESGEITVSAAAEIAKEPPEEQHRKMALPTTREAMRLSKETGNAVLGRDGRYHQWMPEEKRKQRTEYFDTALALRSFAQTMYLTPEQFVASIPSYNAEEVHEAIKRARKWINQVHRALRKEAGNEAG